MLRALLIDDEADARADLRESLAPHPAIQIIGETGHLAEARERLAADDYDLVFLDIQLRGATGFDLVPLVRPSARIVFVTAHDQYALRAFEVNALDYLLKPIDPARLVVALTRVLAAFAAPAPDPATPAFFAPDTEPAIPLRPTDTVLLRNGTQGRFVPLRQISAILADQNYSVAHLVDGAHILLRRTLKSWEDHLPATHFMRVHRTAIVNLECITRYERDREEHTELFIEGLADPIPAVRKQWPDLQEKLTRLRPAL